MDRDVALAIDTGGTKARIYVVGKEGVIDRERFRMSEFQTLDGLSDALYRSAESLLSKNDINPGRIAGVGHGSAGVPDTENYRFHNGGPHIPPSFMPLDLAPRLAGKYGIKEEGMVVLNDCQGGALGELYFGWKPDDVKQLPAKERFTNEPGAFRVSPKDKQKLPEKFKNLFYVTSSTGENYGIIYEGRLIGRPEAGHDFHGDKDLFGNDVVCGGACGGSGHIEAVHSATGLGKVVYNAVKNGNVRDDSELYGIVRKLEKKGYDMNRLLKEIPPLFYNAVEKGDETALMISDWHNDITCREYIQRIMAGGLQPQVIAFGGSMTKNAKFSIYPAFAKYMKSVRAGSHDYNPLQPMSDQPVLAVCKDYGKHHVALGAAAGVFQKVYGI